MRHTPKSSRTLSLAIAMALGSVSPVSPTLAAPPAAGALPTPCAGAGSCGAAGPSAFVTSGKASATSYGGKLTVNQTSGSATLNWASFNIGSGSSVVFNQPGSTSVALNRIYQADPSQIFGVLRSNGQVYLINPNGFLFGNGSSVNVGGLVASSLNVSDQVFSQGILNPALLNTGTPAFVQGLNADGTQGAVIPATVRVDNGATIATNTTGGRILLAANTVDNAGSISAPDGQVILAAGERLYLQASQNSNLRGLIVEVDSSVPGQTPGTGGVAINEASGAISAARGNVSMVGLAVNQLGRVTATTSVSANGSIRLVAGDTVHVGVDTNGVLERTRGGTVTLGPGSLTEVLPDTSAGSAVDAAVQQPSVVDVEGAHVLFQSGSQVIAPGGMMTVTARTDPDATLTLPPSTQPDGSSIRVDTGAVIDLSGRSDSVPVATNIVEAQLRGTELADSPQQRNGALRGQTVYVDVRQGTATNPGTTIANLSGEAGLVERDIYQRTSAGGSVAFDSTGDVAISSGSKVNVSGGAVTYTPGWIQTSYLVTADGRLVPIGQASETTTYVGVVNPTVTRSDDRWGTITVSPNSSLATYDPGYVQGSNAGSITILAPTMVVQGNLLGSTTVGTQQRATGSYPLGGQLVIGQSAAGLALTDLRAPAIDIVANPAPITVADNASLPASLPLQLAGSLLTQDGFSRITLYSNTSINVDPSAPLSLPPASSLSFIAPAVSLNAPITIPGGSINATALQTAFTAPDAGGISVGPAVSLDVRGNWTNDGALAQGTVPTSTVALNGGSITLNQTVLGGTLSIGNDASLAVSGGAWAQQGGALKAGRAGSITLNDGPGGTLSLGNDIGLEGYGVQGATNGSYGPGGTFSLTAPRIEVVASGPLWESAQTVTADRTTGGSLALGTSLFSSYGFSQFILTGDAPALSGSGATSAFVIAPGAQLDLVAPTYSFTAAGRAAGSAANLAQILTPTVAPSYLRSPTSLTLVDVPNANARLSGSSADLSELTIGAGATISADPQSVVTVSSAGGIDLEGQIRVPSGSVTLTVPQPANQYDAGFSPTPQILLGAASVIDVAGTSVYTPNSAGLLTGSVLAGGTVNLAATRGSVNTSVGSQIDVSGTDAGFDIQPTSTQAGVTRTTLATAGGTINVAAPESISLLGTMRASAGSGGELPAAGGTLSVSLSRVTSGFGAGPPENAGTFPSTPRIIELDPGAPRTTMSPESGLAVLDPAKIAAAGFDNLSLSADRITLFNGTSLSLPGALTLQTPGLSVAPGGTASLSAAYVSLGTGTALYTATAPTAGTAVLNLHGTEFVDLSGTVSLLGIQQATISSGGAMELRGGTATQESTLVGSLSTAGNLTLAASEIYPSTATQYSINGGTTSTVTIEQVGSRPGTPLSANGSLTVNADSIVQDGTLIAPFGSISLNAVAPTAGATASDGVLTLGAGSYTSVSGAGAVIPYGQVNNSTAWVYGLNTTDVNSVSPTAVTGVPGRVLTLNGAHVNLASGSTSDVSGGGELYASEFTPGTGGTVDGLANSAQSGLYAILPASRGQYAAYDPLLFSDSGLTPGRSVYLAGGAGLAPGYYSLLPARYALLPGAVLIRQVSGYSNIAPGTTALAPDGGTIVSGYTTLGQTGLTSGGYVGFEIQAGSYARQIATYTDNTASSFFAKQAATAGVATPILPADAGTLALTVSQSIEAEGDVIGTGASGGRNALIEISAPSIQIDGSTVSGATTGVAHLSATELSSWSPGRLLIGGTLSAPDAINVGADSVTVASGASLTAPEIIVVANDSIAVGSGAKLQSTSSADAKSVAVATAPQTIGLDGADSGNAAFLAVSDLAAYVPTRSGDTGGVGAVTVASGAILGSRGAISIDVPGGATLATGVLAGPGANLALGSANIIVGNAAPTPNALVLDSSILTTISAASAVELTASQSIGFTQTAQIGSASLGSLTMNAPVLAGLAPDVTATVAARQVTLGSNSTAAGAATGGTGTLAVNAGALTVGPGYQVENGFGRAALTVAGTITGAGTGGVVFGGDLSVSAAAITTQSGADTTIAAPNGALSLASNGAKAPSSSTLAAGGALSITAGSINDGIAVTMPSGQVTLQSSGGLSLSSTAAIDVSGIVPSALGITTGSPGGRVGLSAGGDISLAKGSVINVSGATGADGGAIAIVSGGTATISATLDGAAQSGKYGARISVAADSIADFSDLTASVGAGGFTGSQAYETRSGSLDVGAGTTLTARSVTLVADAGAVTIEGAINASGAVTRGNIEIDAGTGVSIAGSAALSANGTDGVARGGTITVGTESGAIQIDAGAQVSANGAGSYGALTLRAPTVGADVAITGLPSDLSRVDQVFVQPVQLFALNGGTPTASVFNAAEAQVASWVAANGTNVMARLGASALPNASLSPYLDFRYTGDLTLGALNLNAWRFNGAAGTVEIEATGNLSVAGNISDGFVNVTTGRRPHQITSLDLAAGPSSAITLVAGADFSSASPTGVVAGAAADLTLASGVYVRTGTGNITLAAAEDIGFGSQSSVYTGGAKGAPTAASLTTAQLAQIPYTTYPNAGGSVLLVAGRDISATIVTQTPNDWQPRTVIDNSGVAAPTWGIDASHFDWNVGALGGGDVSIVAGRDAVNISAATADSRTLNAAGVLTNFGGGNLSVTTGRDLLSSAFYVANGIGTLRAGGSIGSNQVDGAGNPLGSLLYAGSTSYSLGARGDVIVEGEVQPTTIFANLPAGTINVPTATTPQQYISELGFFWRYDPTDVLDITSTGGTVTLKTGQGVFNYFDQATTYQTPGQALAVLAPNVILQSFGKDVAIDGTAYLFPATRGDLSVYAARDVNISGNGSFLAMLDTPSTLVHGPTQSTDLSTVTTDLIPGLSVPSTNGAIHTGDSTPVVIAAGRDILGNDVSAGLYLPKSAEISAGRNLVDLGLSVQNVNDSDVTLVEAGGTITYSTGAANLADTFGGGGRVDVVAGGTIDLGFSQGITTTGSLLNGNLTTTSGANLTVIAGLSKPMDVPAFLQSVVSPSTAYQAEVISFVEQQTGQSGLSYAAAQTAFLGLAPSVQRPLLVSIFFNALVQSGRQANTDPAVGFTAGFAAINALFPNSNPTGSASSPYAGDLGLSFSQIYTLDGGSINLLVPGGTINVGLANPPSGLAALGLDRAPSQLGIVAEGPGDVNIFSYGDVNVNASRVFTLGGGNIAIWSSHGNIDAGRGAKTSVSAPPPTVTVSASGQVSVSFSAAVAGSGIRTIQTAPDQTPGNVDLDAPNGFVNAGDAGIGSAGNLNVAAVGVTGLDNIQVGGTSSGVPPSVSGIGAALAGAAGAASSSSAASTNSVASGGNDKDSTQASVAAAALGWLDVFVTGLGEEACKPDDLDCLRRQKH